MRRFESSADVLAKIDGLAADVRKRGLRQSPLPDRASVLIALTDLFAARKEHTGEEIARYEDMAMRLLADAGPSAQAHVAAQLAAHPQTPAVLIDALLAAGGTAASLILEHSPRLGDEALMNAALHAQDDAAAGLARRKSINVQLTRELARRRDGAVLRALARQSAALHDEATLLRLIEAAREDRELASILFDTCPDKSALGPLFLQAPPPARAIILDNAEAVSFTAGSIHRVQFSNRTLNTWMIERARKGRWGLVAQELARLTKLPRAHVDALIADGRGEGLAVLLAAVGMPREDAVYIFLACPPAISHSCERVYALAELMDRLPAFAALHLATQCAPVDAAAQRQGVYEASYDTGALDHGVRGAQAAPRRREAGAVIVQETAARKLS